jgi:predicted nuclease of predicted toxin-antitoxin system
LKIVADENVDIQIVERLRVDGHEVLVIAELAPGIDDETVLGHSRQANAVLLTADKDFGELVFRQRLIHSGVLFIRLAGLAPELKAELVARAFEEHADELLTGFGVLTKRALRLRKHRP